MNRFARCSILIALLLAAFFTWSWNRSKTDALASGQQESDTIKRLGIVNNRELREISGIARSRRKADHFWVHNDSGDQPRIFLLSPSGETLGTWLVESATAVDWEDIASFSVAADKHYLLVADVGDNQSRRDHVSLYLIAEPPFPNQQHAAQVKTDSVPLLAEIKIRYEDGPRNCEAVAVDPISRCGILIEKLEFNISGQRQAGIYHVDLSAFVPEWRQSTAAKDDATERDNEPIIAKRIASWPLSYITAMDIDESGRYLVARTYSHAFLVHRQEHEAWADALTRPLPQGIQLPIEPQGEAICFGHEPTQIITISERPQQPLWQITLPPARKDD